MVADILGFSKMIGNLSAGEQTQRISDWTELVEETKNKVGIEELQLISDTLFVRVEDSVAGLKRLLQFAQRLLDQGVGKSFPLRGAIVHGEVAWGHLTYGSAVVEAYEYERTLDWIGIACMPKLPGLEALWDWDLVVCYPVPSKTGFTQLVPAISWKVPSAMELVDRVSSHGLMKIGDQYKWEVVSKVERTIQFGMYIRWGKADSLNPRYFQDIFPMHWLEARLQGAERPV